MTSSTHRLNTTDSLHCGADYCCSGAACTCAGPTYREVPVGGLAECSGGSQELPAVIITTCWRAVQQGAIILLQLSRQTDKRSRQ